MSDDLIERLRDTGRLMPKHGHVTVGREAVEAADEITALRARLEAVEKLLDGWRSMACQERDRAERAEAALATAQDVDAIEQAMSDIFAEGGDVRAAAEYVSQTIRALIAQEQEPTDVSIVSGDKPRT